MFFVCQFMSSKSMSDIDFEEGVIQLSAFQVFEFSGCRKERAFVALCRAAIIRVPVISYISYIRFLSLPYKKPLSITLAPSLFTFHYSLKKSDSHQRIAFLLTVFVTSDFA